MVYFNLVMYLLGDFMQHIEENGKRRSTNVIPFIPSSDFYFTKGIEAFKKRKFELALKWMKKAVERTPDHPLYQSQLSVIYTEIGLYHEANQLLNNVLKQNGEDYLDCYYLLANNYAHLGLLNDARRYAQLYLENDPEGDFSDDAYDLLELVELDDDDELDLIEDELLIYQETVFYYMEHQQLEKAYPLLEEMITLFPEHKITKHDLAYCSFYLGDREKAIERELELITEKSNLLYSYLNLALFYYEQNNREQYEHYINILLNVYPIHEHQKLRVATVLSKTGYYNEAVERYQVITKSMVKSHLSYFKWYSKALVHIDCPKKAESVWEEGCSYHPELKNADIPWKV